MGVKKGWFAVVAVVLILVLAVVVLNGSGNISTGNAIVSYGQVLVSNSSGSFYPDVLSNSGQKTFGLTSVASITKLTVNWSSLDVKCQILVSVANSTGLYNISGYVNVSNSSTWVKKPHVNTYNLNVASANSVVLTFRGSCISAAGSTYKIYSLGVNGSAQVFYDCFTTCASNGSGVYAPQISNINSSCYLNEGCGSATILPNSNTGSFSYDFLWLYKYKDGSNKTVCACNGTQSVGGVPTGASAPAGAYNLPLNIIDDGSKIISNVTFYVLANKASNRSNSASSVINVNYRCQNGCYVLGQNVSASVDGQSETNKYRTCVNLPAPNHICMNYSEVKTCDAGLKFVNGACQYAGTFNCNGEGDFCNESGISISHASLDSSKSCVLAGVGCYKCDGGYALDSAQKVCVNSSCMTQVSGMNSCSYAGGLCKNTSISGAILNPSLDCCSSNGCYICNAGYHVSNGTCVSDDCSGFKPHGNNFTLGVNNTNVSSVNMTWNYIVGPVGACQWNCSSDYRLNISDNLSCVYGKAMCSDSSVNGICTKVSLIGGVNYSASAICDSGSCFVCDNSLRYFSNGTNCVLNNSCASGMVWNGLTCVSPMASCTGCVLGTKCIGSSEGTKIMRVNVNISGTITKAYCDPASKMFAPLVTDNQTCSYNAQCASNLCGADLRCLNIAKEVKDASSLMKKVYCWFSTGFSLNSTAYNACLAAS